MRKFLIDLLSCGIWKEEWPFTPPECVEYLEKQKEQKQVEWSERDEKILASVMLHIADKSYMMGRRDERMEMMKQGFTFEYTLIGRNTIENLDMDALRKAGIAFGDKVKVVIVKKEDDND